MPYFNTCLRNPAIDAGLFVENGDNLLEGRNLLAITTVFVCSRPWGMTSIWNSMDRMEVQNVPALL